MKIKMVDIARHLGVSKATVSLAVNGKPGVNEETRRMVLECLEEMKKNNGVIPVKENIVTVSGHPVNQMIKIVIVNHSKGVACNSETDLWSDVLATFDSEARRLGYLYGVTYLNDDITQTEAVITECNMDFVAGIILFGTELKEEDQNVYMNAFASIFNSNTGSGQIYSYEVLWIICTRKVHQIFIISAQGKIIIIIEFVRKRF